jgi:hypothetical protein
MSILRKRVTYETVINGSTIGDHLASGVLFPSDYDEQGKFVLEFPLVVLHGVSSMFGFDFVRQLDPFKQTGWDDFEKYICNAIITFCHCLTLEGNEVSVGELFAGSYGTDATKAKTVTIKQDMKYRETSKVITNLYEVLCSSASVI